MSKQSGAESGSDQPQGPTPTALIEEKAKEGAPENIGRDSDVSGDGLEESMADCVMRVAAVFSHNDPCIQYLKTRGVDLCDTEGLNSFARDPSPLEPSRGTGAP